MLRAESKAPGTTVLTVGTIAILVLLNLPLSGEWLYWLATAGILFYVRFVERRPFTSIGLRRPSWQTFVFGILTGAVMLAGMASIYLVLFPALHITEDPAPTKTIQHLPLWLNLMILVRAAIFEEIFFRGFTIERVAEITRLRWLGALISVVTFTYAHLSYWGWAHLIVAAFGGVVLAALYLWRRDLAANMIAHFTTDAVGLLLI